MYFCQMEKKISKWRTLMGLIFLYREPRNPTEKEGKRREEREGGGERERERERSD